MPDWPDLLARTYDVVRVPVARIDDMLLDRATPCEQWTVRDLFEHMVHAIDMFATAAGAVAYDGPTDGAALDRFDVAVRRNLAAWASLVEPPPTLSVPFGEFPTALVAGMNQLDSLVHGWDIGASLGVPVSWPADLADVAMQTANVRVPQGRGGVWGPEVPARGSSAGEVLLAFTGRDTAAWQSPISMAG